MISNTQGQYFTIQVIFVFNSNAGQLQIHARHYCKKHLVENIIQRVANDSSHFLIHLRLELKSGGLKLLFGRYIYFVSRGMNLLIDPSLHHPFILAKYQVSHLVSEMDDG
jgi:hypothetical protein